jgi:transposase
MEQLDYNLLYRWFVGLAPDDPVWDATTFTKNRERLQPRMEPPMIRDQSESSKISQSQSFSANC